MEIHRPKPIHNWREFLKEVGIIVLGVCIALGAEQLVAMLHNAQLARETRATARAELQSDLQNFLNRRVNQPCIDRRLDEIAKLIATSDRPGYRPPSWIGRPQVEILNTSGWDAAAQAGRAALLGDKEQAELGRLYGQLRELYKLQREEQKAWAEMRQLEDQPRVDPQMRADVRSALQQARLLNWNIRVDLEQPEKRAEKLGIMEGNPRPKGSPMVCLPTDTLRAEAVAKSNYFFGDSLGEP
jgi:hypothetical protein